MERTLALISLILIVLPWVSAEFTVSDLELVVYRDGYVKVEYQIIPEEYVIQITVPLLGENYENLFVVDENGEPLNLEVNGNEVIIYVGDAQIIRMSYYTSDLTNKNGLVWMLNVSSPYPFSAILPEDAIIVELSDIPLSISANTLSMPEGNQSIGYTLKSMDIEERPTNAVYGIIVGLVIIAGLLLAFIRKPKKREQGQINKDLYLKKMRKYNLNEEEQRALLYILDKGGRASQAEVRKALGIPKTTAWRMFQRLEKQGLVKIVRGAKENWVELIP